MVGKVSFVHGNARVTVDSSNLSREQQIIFNYSVECQRTFVQVLLQTLVKVRNDLGFPVPCLICVPRVSSLGMPPLPFI